MKKIIFLLFLLISSFTFAKFINQGHYDTITDLAKHPTKNIVITVSNDESIILWDLNNYNIINTITIDEGAITSVSISTFGNYFAVGNEDGKVYLYDFKSLDLIYSENIHQGKVTGIGFDYAEKSIFTSSIDETIANINIEKKEVIKKTFLPAKIISMKISPDGKKIVAGGDNGNLYLMTTDKGNVGSSIQGVHKDWITDIAFSPDSKKIATVSWDLTLKIISLETEKVIQNVVLNTDKTLNSVSWSKDNKHLTISSSDKNIYIYSIEPFDFFAKLEGHTSKVYDAEFLEKDNILVSVGADSYLNVWNLNYKEVINSFSGY